MVLNWVITHALCGSVWSSLELPYPDCAMQTSCSFSGFLCNLLSSIRSFAWDVWGECLRALPPLGSWTLRAPCLLTPSWSCHDQLVWEAEELHGEKAESSLVLGMLQSCMCFLMWLSTTARVGDTMFWHLYCEGWNSHSYHGDVQKNTQAHVCGPLYEGIWSVKPRAKSFSPGWVLMSLTFVSWFPVEHPVFSALPRGNIAYAFLEFDSWAV